MVMMMRGPFLRLVLAVLTVAAFVAPARAQDFRGSIMGTVTDATGAVLPGVTVTVTNDDTGVQQTIVTDNRGLFQVLYLNPGKYTVTIELSGFKKVIRSANEVRVGDVLRVDAALETGGLEETIVVTAEPAVLETNTGVRGTTIDAKQIAELPLGDGTAYMLTRLAPGIMDSSDLHFARPMDNGNLGGIVANGVQGGNEFTIDGAPNMSNARGVGFSPPSDAISQFKVQTNAFDAQTGHTAGAVVNLALKSGANALHLATGYFNRDSSRSETPRLTELAGGTKPSREYNRATATVSGPIVRDRTFFMAAYEYLRDVQPEASSYTVPTQKMRGGDFTEFTTQIFDPQTATQVGNAVTRTAFQGNRIDPSRINPVAGAYAALYPLPNRPGTESNYFTNQLRPVRLQGHHGSRRPQLQLVQPAVSDDVLQQAAGRSVQLGAGQRIGRPGRRLCRDPGIRLPQQHWCDDRLHLVPVPHAPVRPAGQRRELRRVPGSGHGVQSGGSRVLTDGAPVDGRLPLPAVVHLRELQRGHEREFDDRVARIAAVRLR